MIQKIVLTVCFVFCCITEIRAQSFVTASPQRGEGIYGLLRRYRLPTTGMYINKFRELNEDILGAGDELHLEFYYHIPILKYNYDGSNIRSTLGLSDYQLAKSIQDYNEEVQAAGLKPNLYTADMELWVPYYALPDNRLATRPMPAAEPRGLPSIESKEFAIFGKDYSAIEKIDNSLSGYYFYLDSGHGGPDPGAYGVYGAYRLYEDEYAYDITLRLARRLIQHGATVYIIVRDPNDGIRDVPVLRGDWDEYYYTGAKISRRSLTRLEKRAAIINDLYQQNRALAKGQYTIVLHVDSRSNSQRIDLFYYYKKNNSTGRKLAQTLHQRVRKEYAEHQPGRGYSGTVTWRDLYMLQHVQPTTVYIEVANIRNKLDQDRLVIVNNRQAVANWLCDGVKDFIR